MGLLYKIPVKYIRIYLLVLWVWSILGLLLFPDKREHLIITFATATMFLFLRKYKYYRLANREQKKIIAGCVIFSLFAGVIMAL